MTAQLYAGRWQDALAQIDRVDAVICDPPYGTTACQWDSVIPFAPMWASWVPRCRGWFVAFTSSDLAPAYVEALEGAGRYVFAPLPFFSPGSRVRLSGDGPSSWTCWIVVARPRTVEFTRWGTLPGGYVFPPEDCEVVGGKPLGLMRAIVRDYSRPGDLVCDPFVGSGTTLLAAVMEGRRAVGAEEKPEHYEIARKRLARGYTPTMFAE